ncbi:MAG: threonylcarbamoyl-AMP synthase [Deltaproteobacteria bacterium]|nr:threonylcarbamoyl-AMP synthase [Deltaproteobacteria bacterium]
MAAVRLKVSPDNPSEKHIARAVQVLAEGGVVVYPTDTAYGLGCDIYAKRAIERIYMLKRMDRKRPLSFVCSDLSDIARYAGVDNLQYRILRQHLPGPYTFILPATKEVPKILTSRSRTVGIRVPKHPVCMALVKRLDHPIVSTTASLYRGEVNSDENERAANRRFVTAFDLEQQKREEIMVEQEKNPANEEVFTDPDVIEARIGHSVDLILDVGPLPSSLSTVVDLTGAQPKVLRKGIGNTALLV